jgi:hypothetical protein
MLEVAVDAPPAASFPLAEQAVASTASPASTMIAGAAPTVQRTFFTSTSVSPSGSSPIRTAIVACSCDGIAIMRANEPPATVVPAL